MHTERVEAISPVYGMRITDKLDPCPVAYSGHEVVDTLNSLTETRHDYDMLMETASFEEVDAYYNPGEEEVPDEYILEAIVIEKFSKTDRRMAAVVRILNKHLGDSEINALDPIVGKPKKTGTYAYVTVQLPFSDGQIVSVIFHSPEGDKKRIGPADEIIAFRWLLNKRDITHVVAPEDGSEVSLETIAKRLTQLVVKNSARFERTQKEAQAERQELDTLREDLKAAEERQQELMGEMVDTSKAVETAEAELSNILALVEKQKAINAELQAKLDGLRKSGQGAGGSDATETVNTNTESDATTTQNDDGQRTLPVVAEVKSGVIKGATNKEAVNLAREWIQKNINGPAKTVIGEIIIDANTIRNSLEHSLYQSKLDALPAIKPTLENGNYLGSLTDKDGKTINNHYFAAKIKINDEDRVIFIRVRKAEGDTNRFYVHEIYTEEEIKKALDSPEFRETTPAPGTQAFYKKIIADYLKVKGEIEDNPPDTDSNEPSFVNDLNDILAGKYDNAYSQIEGVIDRAVEAAEAAGEFKKYEDLFNQAVDHQIALRKKMREAL